MDHPDFFDTSEADSQDLAEVHDETHLNEDEDVFTTLEEADDVLDVTHAVGDDDDDEARDEADFDLEAIDDDAIDDDAIDDDELEDQPDLFQPEDNGLDDDDAAAVEQRLPGNSIEGLDQIADADLVEGGEDDFTNFQSKNLSDEEIAELGYATKVKQPPKPQPRARGNRPENVKDHRDPHVEENLDHGVEETFPASDPVSISPGAD